MEEPIHNFHLTPSSAEKAVPFFLYEFVKTYLYAVFTKTELHAVLQVPRMLCRSEKIVNRPVLVSVTDEPGNGRPRVANTFIEATAYFKGFQYEIAMYRDREAMFSINCIYVLGTEPAAREPQALLEFLLKESVRSSSFNNGCLCVVSSMSEYSDQDIYVERMSLDEDSLADVYLPKSSREHISLFINTLLHYEKGKPTLRYLFSGKPGTGKTKIIRALAHECRGKATFIFADGSETRIDSLFEFANYFHPCVLCIDDIDIMALRRDEGISHHGLARLLQRLDGFNRGEFFLLATTNDKQLVDLAASRPGRFDLVIDVSQIHPAQYSALIRSKTETEKITALFDDEILKMLEAKKVTGAFIANLVKHLDLVNSFDSSKINREYLMEMIAEAHRGFYKEPEPTNGTIGFRSES